MQRPSPRAAKRKLAILQCNESPAHHRYNTVLTQPKGDKEATNLCCNCTESSMCRLVFALAIFENIGNFHQIRRRPLAAPHRDGDPPMIRPLLLTLVIFGLAACETTKGAGRDLQKAGEAISGTAQNVQNAL